MMLEEIFGAEKDHPRLRGEKGSYAAIYRAIAGSPPLTRGKGVLPFYSIFLHRITPAYAGKSAASVSSSAFEQDHPRLRGEKSF